MANDKYEQHLKFYKLLESVERIQTFLEEECSCSSACCWDSDNETVMHTDIGYFFQGLEELRQYLMDKKGVR